MVMAMNEAVDDAVSKVVVTTEKHIDDVIEERIAALPVLIPAIGLTGADYEHRTKYTKFLSDTFIKPVPIRTQELPLIANLSKFEYDRRNSYIAKLMAGKLGASSLPTKFVKPVQPEGRGLEISRATNTVMRAMSEGWAHLLITPLQKAIYEKLLADPKADLQEAFKNKIKGDTKHTFILSRNKRRAEDKPKQVRTGFIKTRVSFGIPLETWTKNFDTVKLTTGKYKFIYKGGDPQTIIPNNVNLPIYGSAEGKEFVIRRLRAVPLEDNTQGLEIVVDLNENIIPLLLIAGAVGSSLLAGTGFVLHKTQKLLSSPIIWVIAIAILGFLFLRFKAAGIV